VKWKALFGAIGLASLIYILKGYGFERLAQELLGLGWWSVPLALTFLPVAACYALAWQLVTPGWKISRFPEALRLTVISVAWNNLSPFVKMLGEPVRLVMLDRVLPGKRAAQSVVLYNIVHSVGTLLSFFIGAAILLLVYPISATLNTGLIVLLLLAPLLAASLLLLPYLAGRMPFRPSKKSRVYKLSFWMRWSFSKIRVSARRHPARIALAIFLETLARFVEGVTFYVAFLALGHFVPLFACALLDVGRSLIDNAFFFIPYQVGSREGGVLLVASDALKIGTDSVVSSAVLYRLVEILWMGIGYALWMMEGNRRRSSR
jgi:hypothetical protein